MENDAMSPSGANLGRRAAIGGGRADKVHPPLPPEANPAAIPRSATPTGPRSSQHPPKTPARSATIDPSMPVASAAKQLMQPSAPPAPPGLPAPPVLSTPSVPPASGKQTPIDEWVAIAQPNASVEELQAKVMELQATVKQKDAEIQEYKDNLKKYHQSLAEREASLVFLTNKCQNLESQPYRQEALSIRRHLQVDELLEPWEINKKFGEIVRKVEDISRDMGEALGRLQPIGKHTTTDLLKLLSRASEGQSLVAAKPTAELELEDFIDFGCRALINEALFDSILGTTVFHPGLGQDDNAFYSKMYNRLRREESQVVAGRWRISTLKVLAEHPYSPKEGALRLCKDNLLPFCSTVVESKSCSELIQSMHSRFEELFKRAADWNHLAKHSVIMLDFHPHFQHPGTPFEGHNTQLEGRRPKLPASNAILLTSKLGLWSSSAVGNGKEPDYSFQTKATVLAAEYFA